MAYESNSQLESILKYMSERDRNLHKPKKFTGYVMSGNKEVAKVVNNEIEDIDIPLSPLYLSRTQNFEGWLKTRCIDTHRTNSRLLRKVLRLTTAEEEEIVLSVNSATITDNYWTKDIDSNLKYEDVVFKYNDMCKLALYGKIDDLNYQESRTPELTSVGSFEKCWFKDHDKWLMIKKGSDEEIFSELFVYHLGKLIGLNMAIYLVKEKQKEIVSIDFTNNAEVNFEPMHSILDEEEDYIENINILYNFDKKLVHQYLDIIFLDAIVMNVDRHTFNYGVLRDTHNGNILKMAPNFDNNLSLVARGKSSNLNRNDILVKEFIKALEYIKNLGINYNIPKFTEEMLEKAYRKTLSEVDIKEDYDKGISLDYILPFCVTAYKKIIDQ